MYVGERFNACSHLAGFALAIPGAAWLLARSVPSGDLQKISGALVFSFAVIALYAASTLYHSTRGATKAFWERADHCAIYLLIAGTVTPFALAPPGIATDPWRLAELGALWSLATLGMAHAVRAPATSAPPLWLYIAMGWLGVAITLRGSPALESTGLALLLGGGALYTVGTFFYLNRRGWRHAHGVWHLFVLGGTACHYVAIGAYVL